MAWGCTSAARAWAWVMSWTWPPVRLSANGLPRASTITWILVVGPPRERPMAWSSPPFECARTVLMSSDDGGVDHRVFVVRIVSQRLEKILPHAALRPPREPRVNVLPVAEALGQIPPWRPQAEFPNHRLNEKAIAQFAIASDMSRTTRQQMFNPSTKRRLVWYTVDPPTPTLAAIASSLAP